MTVSDCIVYLIFVVETITSAYDKMSEIDAFNILKKKILKGENRLFNVHMRKFFTVTSYTLCYQPDISSYIMSYCRRYAAEPVQNALLFGSQSCILAAGLGFLLQQMCL